MARIRGLKHFSVGSEQILEWAHNIKPWFMICHLLLHRELDLAKQDYGLEKDASGRWRREETGLLLQQKLRVWRCCLLSEFGKPQTSAPSWIYGEELTQPVSPSAPSVQGTGRGRRLSKSEQIFSDPRTLQRRKSQTENNDVTADVKITLNGHKQPCPHHTQPSATLSLQALTHTHTHTHTHAHLGSVKRALPPSPLSSKPLLSTDTKCPSPPSLFIPLLLSSLSMVSGTTRKIWDLLTQRCGPHLANWGRPCGRVDRGLGPVTPQSWQRHLSLLYPPGQVHPAPPTQGSALRFLRGRRSSPCFTRAGVPFGRPFVCVSLFKYKTQMSFSRLSLCAS